MKMRRFLINFAAFILVATQLDTGKWTLFVVALLLGINFLVDIFTLPT